MFGPFEKLVSPYPDGAIAAMPQGFFRFLWAWGRGTQRYIAAMTVLGAIGVFEALLFRLYARLRAHQSGGFLGEAEEPEVLSAVGSG